MIIALILIALGAIIKFGKAYYLMAGYNTMSEEEKAKYDVEKLGNLFFWVMVYLGGLIAAGDLVALWAEDPKYMDYFLYFSMATGVPFLLWQANSSKYKKKED